jgi:murein L,D-transpeptidase YafK
LPAWPSAGAPPETVGAPAAAPVYADVPLPPSRPAGLEKLAAVTEREVAAPQPAAPAAAPAETQVARLSEPTLRPAPDDAFQPPPPKFGMGDPVFVRIFKQEGQLELWLKKNGRYSLYKTFPICKWSGRLGPKLKEADYQSPEGFYSVSARQLNPHSNYYRAFNVGYPNAFDRQNGRTGGLVMVHGACKSVGCFAMTDRGIEEIYGFVEAALRAGQKEIPVHIFPFRMTEANIARETGGGWLAFVGASSGYQQWQGFWKNLKEGYDLFEHTGQPPTAFACGDHYEFDSGSAACKRVAGW